MSENWHPPKVYNSEETGPNILNISDDDETAYEKKSNLEDSFDETTCHLTENSKENEISDGRSTDNILSSKKDVPTHNNATKSPKNDENAENIPPRNKNSPEKGKQKTKSHKMKKEKSYQNSDILSAAVSESQIDMEDFSTFENESSMISDISDTRREYDLPHGMYQYLLFIQFH